MNLFLAYLFFEIAFIACPPIKRPEHIDLVTLLTVERRGKHRE